MLRVAWLLVFSREWESNRPGSCIVLALGILSSSRIGTRAFIWRKF